LSGTGYHDSKVLADAIERQIKSASR